MLEAVGDAERFEFLLRYQQSVDFHRNTPVKGSIAMLARNCQRARGDIAEHSGAGERRMGEHGGTCERKIPAFEAGTGCNGHFEIEGWSIFFR